MSAHVITQEPARIVESTKGVVDAWRYKKYDDGTIVLYQRKSYTGVNITTSYGNWFRSASGLVRPTMPAGVTPTSAVAQVESTSGEMMFCVQSGTASACVVCPAQASNATIVLLWTVHGTWT